MGLPTALLFLSANGTSSTTTGNGVIIVDQLISGLGESSFLIFVVFLVISLAALLAFGLRRNSPKK